MSESTLVFLLSESRENKAACLLDMWQCERVRLSVVFESHCFSSLKTSLAMSGLICRQVFGYLKDFDEKIKKIF